MESGLPEEIKKYSQRKKTEGYLPKLQRDPCLKHKMLSPSRYLKRANLKGRLLTVAMKGKWVLVLFFWFVVIIVL